MVSASTALAYSSTATVDAICSWWVDVCRRGVHAHSDLRGPLSESVPRAQKVLHIRPL